MICYSKFNHHIRLLFTLPLLWVVLSVSAAQPDIAAAFDRCRGIDAARSSMLVISLSDGEVLADYNSDAALVPASIMKCITTAGLLSKVGPDYQFVTSVWRDGPVADGLLEGNLIVKGSGDPSLHSRYEPGSGDFCSEIADALAESGVCRIGGRIIIDESLWSGPAIPPTWASGDLSQSYGTGSHGLNFEDNATGRSSVRNPAAVFEARLRSALSRRGISVGGGEYVEAKRHKMLDHKSAPLDEIMRSCMMRSDNQYAEALLRTISVADGGKGNTEDATDLQMHNWRRKGVDTNGIRLIDGSGLSRSNRMTARFMAGVLTEMSGNPYYASFFPLAGQEGTLRNFLAETALDSYIALKTGSMKGIQCYAGYKLDDDYKPTHVVVVMLNNMPDRSSARKTVGDLLLEIFDNSTQTENS